ncbi:MAG: response regulator [Synergistaceae bacterium]|jgi:signal transduction histidine kinase/DNA-binding response OmpR family regulator|nr:response regulator [Synergistaceae bacterium]
MMKFKSIASRIIFSIVPVTAISTIVFIIVISRILDAQINERVNGMMLESLDAAIIEIRSELDRNADIAKSLAIYAATSSPESIKRGEMKEFLIRTASSSKHTDGIGIWFGPYAFNNQRYHSSYVRMADGHPVYDGSYELRGDYHNSKWYLNGQGSRGEAVWSDVYYDSVSKTSMVTATVPFFDGKGAMRGVATADMALADIQNIMRGISIGAAGRAFILGEAGEYITFFDDSRGFGEKITDAEDELSEFGQNALMKKEGTANVKIGSESYRACYRAIPENNWTIVALMNLSEIRGSTLSLILALAVIPFTGVLLASTLSVISVARHLSGVINKVNRFAGLAASGDFSKRIDVVERDEFGSMEDRLNKMMEKMGEMYAHSMDMFRLAQEANQAKNDFLSEMSGELRTPMNAIAGMTSIAKVSRDIEKKDYCLSKIDDASSHLLSVINDILDMSKIEVNKLDLSFSNFSFESILKKITNVINFRIEEKHQQFTVHLGGEIPRVISCDGQRLAQVIANLVGNAIKLTPEYGSIMLDTALIKEENGICTILIEVTDSGIGISREDQTRLFTPLEPGDRSLSKKFGGAGLGLAVSKRIVEMMGGKIWVESKEGFGSKFAFTIEARRVSSERHPILNSAARRENTRILAVDGAMDIRAYFGETAERFGLACDVASDGGEACALIDEKGFYDMYFLDWKIDGISCLELTRRIKSRDKLNPVIIMIPSTEWDSTGTIAREAGADNFLRKPLFPSMIAECINNALKLQDDRPAGEKNFAGIADFKGLRALLAEDVAINREIAAAFLESTSLEIDFAESGREAIEKFIANPGKYDVILMDAQMPEMDGCEAAKRIRALEMAQGRRRVPIIAMTASAFREDIEKYTAAGMDDHISKPLNLEETLSALKKHLRS